MKLKAIHTYVCISKCRSPFLNLKLTDVLLNSCKKTETRKKGMHVSIFVNICGILKIVTNYKETVTKLYYNKE